MTYDLHCFATGKHNAAGSSLEHDLGLPSYMFPWAMVTQIWLLDKQPVDGKKNHTPRDRESKSLFLSHFE